MAAAVGNSDSSDQLRVFVLVDNESAKGVFLSWDAAEEFADKNSYTLDHLMEYETRSDYPDHLHLMAAKWDNKWKFQGEWTRRAPKWERPPTQIRLDHYHCKGSEFALLRRREFDWRDDILSRINPMAPDSAMETKAPTPSALPTGKPNWQPKVSPLKPLDTQDLPKATSETPQPEPDIQQAGKPEEDKDEPLKEKPKLRLTPAAIPQEETEKTPEEEPASREEDESSFSLKKKSRLKLKSKDGPAPIPTFNAIKTPDVLVSGKSSVELAHTDPNAMAGKKPVEPLYTSKPRKIWSLRIIITLLAVVSGWAGGLFWVFRPEPTAASIAAEVITLNRARKIVIEPKMVFFQFDVSPVHQERYIQNLGLEPINDKNPVSIPTYHALSTWEQPNTFIRPPYADSEVDEWWDMKKWDVRYGFIKRWEDGSVLILDFESDTIIGWAQAELIPEILN